MNRRNFFTALGAAACLGAARVYAPVASVAPPRKARSFIALVNAQTYEALQREAERDLTQGATAAREAFIDRYQTHTPLPSVNWRRFQNG